MRFPPSATSCWQPWRLGSVRPTPKPTRTNRPLSELLRTRIEPVGSPPMASRPRLKPSQIVVLLGVGFAIIVAASGIIATIAQQHDESPVSRANFLNVPSAVRGVFYAVLTAVFVA